jgi:hypothetical protein
MCLSAPKIPEVKTAAPVAPVRDPKQSLAQDARVAAQRAQGADDAIGTTALGDPAFGKSLKRATLLGQTA